LSGSSAAAGGPLPGRSGAGDRTGHGAHGRARGRTDADDLLAKVVFALLVLGCFAAFIVTQRLKHTPTAVQEFHLAPVFSPTSPGPLEVEPISFKLEKADEVTVTIVNSADDEVATLVRNLPVARYKPLSLRWNGREGTAHSYSVLISAGGHKSLLAANRGRPAPTGEYRVRLSLRAQDRTFFSQHSFMLVRR
jgi:hypothetical protein